MTRFRFRRHASRLSAAGPLGRRSFVPADVVLAPADARDCGSPGRPAQEQTSEEIARDLRRELVNLTRPGEPFARRHVDLRAFDALAPYIDWRQLIGLQAVEGDDGTPGRSRSRTGGGTMVTGQKGFDPGTPKAARRSPMLVRPEPGGVEARRWAALIRLYARPILGDVPLAELRPLHLQRLYAGLLSDPGRPLSGGTVLNLHLVLTQALGQAVRWGYLLGPLIGMMDEPR